MPIENVAAPAKNVALLFEQGQGIETLQYGILGEKASSALAALLLNTCINGYKRKTPKLCNEGLL
jgi:hypothetical protein